MGVPAGSSPLGSDPQPAPGSSRQPRVLRRTLCRLPTPPASHPTAPTSRTQREAATASPRLADSCADCRDHRDSTALATSTHNSFETGSPEHANTSTTTSPPGGDYAVGAALAKTPPDSDGNWPAAAVCELIEKIASKDLDGGLIDAVITGRGGGATSPWGGGGSERELAAKYRHANERLRRPTSLSCSCHLRGASGLLRTERDHARPQDQGEPARTRHLTNREVRGRASSVASEQQCPRGPRRPGQSHAASPNCTASSGSNPSATCAISALSLYAGTGPAITRSASHGVFALK